VISAPRPDEALAHRQRTKYALTGGCISRSPANIERVRREFRVGNLYINRKITGALVDRQPFGGFKLSGSGPKAGGADYLSAFHDRADRHREHAAQGLRAAAVESVQPATAGE
jgi:RHH-type proline utilization regulon transcriptional repressor/proline dehydrogenase/delta 1-pyrroline-5-carboxylate dehydrogenase